MYQVRLEIFQGPLDVLLRLIQREELDITLVSLAIVTDQFLAYLAGLQADSNAQRTAAQLADFLHVASRLLVIKSRVLLPRPEEAEDEANEEEDMDAEDELVLQLREYKRYKETAAQLRAIEEAGLRTYPRAAPLPHIAKRLAPGEASVSDLVAAFRQVLEAHPDALPVDGVVAPLTVHIGDCIQRILAQVTRYRRVRFSALMRTCSSRLEVIVTFLAMLELIKQQRLRATQERLFGEIYLEARQPDGENVDTAEAALPFVED